MNIYKLGVICLIATFFIPSVFAEERHDEEGNPLVLSVEARRAAGITVDTVALQTLNETLRVPAEVIINAYQSARVTPRIQAQVVARHVQLGDHVEAGQSLVTLTSIALSEAQGNLIVMDREWQRVESLGKKAVGERESCLHKS